METISLSPAQIRNVAIIAHVDHGKTTLVDALLKQSGIFRENEVVETCVMDSNDLERERGITILSKNTAVRYRDYLINIVDTPGHADFGGEVERVLGMVEGCLLIIDANEGPMPQTRFVLRKALEKGLKPIVIVNKIDRPQADPHRAIDKALDLFIELGADDDQADFPVLFASGMSGYAKNELEDESKDLQPLFEAVLRHVPSPVGDPAKPLQLQVTTLDYSEYLGRIIIGKIHNGVIRSGETISLIRDTGKIEKGKVTKLFGFDGLSRIELPSASAGNIVAVAGFADATIGETLASLENPEALPLIRVDEPTLQMTFSVNDSPFAGQEGKFVTSRKLRERLFKELETNVSLRVDETDSPDRFQVSGRGELHLGILIETMRREGYEFQVSKPRVIFRQVDGHIYEPFELLVLDVPDDAAGGCIENLGRRRAEMQNMQAFGNGRTQLEFIIPARGLMGFRSESLRLTRGEGIMSHSFLDYRPSAGEMASMRNGVLISFEEGDSTYYAIQNLEDRGVFFITPGTRVYAGMIIGENNRQQDLELNVCKTKKLTNMRASGGEELVQLKAPIIMSLERALEYINDDELVEVTPKSVRLRKMANKTARR
jgi:GTP-binding protein